MKWPTTEKELAAPVVDWLSAQHFEVYQEVEVHSRVADIVAVDGKRVWTIECKRTMSLELLDQANRWRWLATWCSVAVPMPRRGQERPHIVEQVLMWKGIGLIEVEGPKDYGDGNLTEPVVHEKLNAELSRGARTDTLLKSLHDAQKSYCKAGSQAGRWTKFKGTKDALVSHVRSHPGVSLKEALKAVKHHYASDAGAASRIVDLVYRGVIPELRIERDGKALRLWVM